MRWIYCFFFVIISIVAAKAQHHDFLQKEIELSEQNYSLQQVFKKLEEQNIITAYNSKKIGLDKSVKFPFKESTISNLLKFLEENHAITSKVKVNKIIFTKSEESYTISGFIREHGSGETLAGANILVNPNYGTFSNTYGFYSITLPEGKYQINISYIGYISKKQTFILNQDTRLDIDLKASSQQLPEVIIEPQKNSINKTEFNRINLDKTNLTPIIFGTDDAIKRLQMIPGTGGGITGFSDIAVRGGNVHENLVLLDGVPVYNYNHFPGILSVFNTDALKSIDFYKGQFPARYTGRLSSVTDIKMREGNMQTYHIGGNIDLATLSIFVEGPIIKNKASFIASGRRSWIDGLTGIGNSEEGFDFHLQDINLKANYSPTKDDRVYLSFYSGIDKLGSDKNIEEIETLSWDNNIIALRWNHIFSNKLFSNTLLYFSDFNNVTKSVAESWSDKAVITNKYTLKEFNGSTFFEYYEDRYQLSFGSGIQKNVFKLPLTETPNNNNNKMSVWQWKSYIENKINLNSNIYCNVGLNYIFYHYNEMKKHFFQPRINLNYSINNNSNISVSFSEMYQFIHQLGSYNINLPYAFRLPASETFSPGISRLYELKYISKLRQQKDIISVSLYYKQQKNILRYKPGQDIFNEQLADDWKDQVLKGKRKIRGLEISYYADLSPLQINFSYTYSKNKEQFPTINNHQYYRNALTPKHIFIFTAEYSFNKKHSISTIAGYNTGRYMSIPIYEIESIDDAVNHIISDNQSYVYGKINDFQLNDNYHVDFGYTFQTNETKNGKHIFRLGVNNLFGKLAPFRVTANIYDKKLNIQEVSFPSPIPYISYTFKF